MPFLKEDTYSFQNRSRLWAKAGTEVDIVRGSHGVYIVKAKDGTGNEFAVNDWEMNDDPNWCKQSMALNGQPAKPSAGKAKRQPSEGGPASNSPQGNLF
jgi:hypothetical protein